MARRIYADIDEEVNIRLARSSNVTATQRGFFINDALRMIVNEFPHPEYDRFYTDSIAQSNDSMTPTATDLWWPRLMRDTTNNRPIDASDLDKIESIRKVTGYITQYYWFNNVFYFDRYAQATTAVKIWYKRTVAEFTSGSPEFNQIYDELLVMRAAQIGYSSIGDQSNAAVQKAEGDAYVQWMRLPALEEKKNDRRKGVVVRTR
jgi:hypothetical protein